MDYLIEYLTKKDQTREEILKLAREIVRDCAMLIRRIHKSKEDVFKEDFKSIREKIIKLKELTQYPEFIHYLSTPEQEFVEAYTLYSIKFYNTVPKFEDFEIIKEENYILGIADTIGELRREFLEAIKEDDKEEAERYYKFMEELYDFIMSFDHYYVVDNLRRKQDIARGILERSYGDLVYFIENLKLRKALNKE
ncbi:Translin [Methanocaldococcus infernus ME]|uniref:Translin n=1 Tax=Methanocaldococcus infernus (strain DSM 11812 / JCM 15783 / ME) TaxID=573063 RepID=D5VTE2_METIM|nr:haloacid dehalogenase [Methanocaldococcus infernus]ADG13845.1 Translin [Methanocaldococcus infernus ME]